MNIEISETCGLCAGCTIAINTALNTAKGNKNVVLFKEIVHNKNVNKMLENEGIKTIQNIEEIPSNSTVILRAHGEPKSTYEYLKKNNIKYKDCTCFNVTKIHEKVEEYSKKGYSIIIVGKHGSFEKIHPEVLGTIGWCESAPILVEKLEDLKNFNPQKQKKFYLICQTTFNIQKADEIIEKISKICEDYGCELIVNKSICSAQKQINEKSVELAKKVDFMIVVGGKNSSNTQELYNNLQKYTKVVFIEDVNEVFEALKLNNLPLSKNIKIGLTAGASTQKEELLMLKQMLITFENQ